MGSQCKPLQHQKMLLTNLATVSLFLTRAMVGARDSPSTECCAEKMVGAVSYKLLPGTFHGELPPQCLNGCVYTVSGTSSPKFCFRKGVLLTECVSEVQGTPPPSAQLTFNETEESFVQKQTFNEETRIRRSSLFWEEPWCSINEWDQPQYCKCRKGERIVRFSSHHDNHREDRRWELECSKITGPVEVDEVISVTDTNGWDAAQEWNGVYSNSYLVGVASVHNNHHEDRRYTFVTARSNNYFLTKCSRWRKLNNFDGPFYLRLGSNDVIAAVKSHHNNRREDREFSVITCRLTYLEPEERTHGFATSPNYPRNYPDKYEKEQTIQVEEGNILFLYFTAFNLEYHMRCHYDYLEIRDGDGSLLMWRSCGGVLPSTIISSTNIVRLRFRTDSSQTRTGWRLQWHAKKKGCSELGRKGARNFNPACLVTILAALGSCSVVEIAPPAILGCAAAVIGMHLECDHYAPDYKQAICNDHPWLKGCN